MTQQAYSSADQFFTGTGIMVQGDPFRMNTTGYQDVPLKNKDGSQRIEHFIAVAFPKDQPAATRFNELWLLMQQEAQKHPYAAQCAQMQWQGFRWKMEDGDLPQNVNKPGWKGCWVVKFKNGFMPNVFDENGAVIPSPYQEVYGADGKLVSQSLVRAHTLPCGHFVRVMCSIGCNNSAGAQAGLFMNFHMVQRVGYGPVIQSGPDYSSAMASTAAPALTGMSTMPVAGAMPSVPQQPAGAPAMPNMPQPGGMPAPGMPAMGGAPGMPAMGGAPGMPAMGGAPGMPAMGGAPGMPPSMPGQAGAAPAAPVETPQSRMLVNDFTYDQYISSGWTEDAMIANGKLRAATHPYNQ